MENYVTEKERESAKDVPSPSLSSTILHYNTTVATKEGTGRKGEKGLTLTFLKGSWEMKVTAIECF